MPAHDEAFEAAKNRLNTLKEEPGNDVKLHIYALFKQVCWTSPTRSLKERGHNTFSTISYLKPLTIMLCVQFSYIYTILNAVPSNHNCLQ